MPRTSRLPLFLLALPATAASARAQAGAPVGPVFADGMAQVVEAFRDPAGWIREDLWVETEFDSDGDGRLDRVHVDVTRPGQTGADGLKVAAIYESSPYFAGVAAGDGFFWDPEQELGAEPPERDQAPSIPFRRRRGPISNSLVRTWVPRGFAVVHSSSPGTGLSQGCPTVGGENEELAPKAVVDWLNGRALGYSEPTGGEVVVADWCTGKVGMIGTSYNGTLALAAAVTGVEGLAAIIPDAPNTSYYHYYRANGLVRHPGGYLGEDIDVLYDFINSGDPQRRRHCNRTVRDEILRRRQDRRSGDYNDFWHARNYRARLDGVRAAVLISHGLDDWNVMPSHSLVVYQELRRRGLPVMAYLHQGGHGGPPPLEMQNRWFSRWLYGIENGVEELPPVWIQREGSPRTEPTPYADFPNPDSAPVRLFPGAGGAGWGTLVPAPAGGPQGTETLVDDVRRSGAELAEAERSRHRLLYAGDELREPLHISGTPRLRIRLAADAPAANLSVWLVALPWEEGAGVHDNVVTRGWADPQNHASWRESEPLAKGEFVELEFDLEPDDQIIPAGRHLGLMIFSSDRDFTLWPRPGTRLTIDLDGTRLELPVVGGRAAYERATAGG
ncbi:MAG: Xaa-Pro dipeptidyl-peptidase [Planctomycetota bacterium]|nr:MAG: Xaa-Pro dipeptidyl-peptidase [Planctomycetota bacterium]